LPAHRLFYYVRDFGSVLVLLINSMPMAFPHKSGAMIFNIV